MGAGFQGLPSLPYRDDGTNAYVQYPCEDYAMLFAFMSLLYPDGSPEKADYVSRAKLLLMHVMNAAVQGPPDPAPPVPTDWNDPVQVSTWYSVNAWRRPTFAAGDRSRWHGQAFPLIVDWIYPHLTATEKETIRNVFLLWMEQNLAAPRTGGAVYATTYNDPAALTVNNFRYSVNNFHTAHIRNMAMMSIALDAADDDPLPSGPRGHGVRAYLNNTIGRWLFQTDHMMKTMCQGGYSPEGFAYGPSNIGRMAHLMLALHTSGWDDPTAYPVAMPQVQWSSTGFYDLYVPALLHSLSPKPLDIPAWPWRPALYQPAFYGDANRYEPHETINSLGCIGIYDMSTGNAERLNAVRFIQRDMMEGGAAEMADRMTWTEDFMRGILYFMIMDPAAAPPTDPRPALPLSDFGAGLNRFLSRTGWDENANWFSYKLSWTNIDHQFGDANMFEFWREGEWLTKDWTGYAHAMRLACSEWHNTLTIENNFIDNGPFHNRTIASANGSQFLQGNGIGDPVLVARFSGPDYDYLCGNSTPLHNYAGGAMDVAHASRSIVWLKPDHIVAYDRAESQSAGRYKRFWLNMPGTDATTSVTGNVATGHTAGGQQLFVTTLLPECAQATVDTTQPVGLYGPEAAEGEWTTHRIMVEAPGDPMQARFLHVLQGADAGALRDATDLVDTAGSPTAYAGARIGTTAVLFPRNIDSPASSVAYDVPAATTRHLVTGLVPGGGYTVALTESAGVLHVEIAAGGASQANSGGVLDFAYSPSASVGDWWAIE